MSVLDGYNKYKRYIKTNDGYKLCSQWTSSNTVQMDDGNTLQTNLGAINGITDSLTATSSNIAASAAAVKTLNDSFIRLSEITTPKNGSYIGFIAFTGGSWNAVVLFDKSVLEKYNIECNTYDVAGVGSGVPSNQGVWCNSFTIEGSNINENTNKNAVILNLLFSNK